MEYSQMVGEFFFKWTTLQVNATVSTYITTVLAQQWLFVICRVLRWSLCAHVPSSGLSTVYWLVCSFSDLVLDWNNHCNISAQIRPFDKSRIHIPRPGWDSCAFVNNLYFQLSSYQNIVINLEMFAKNDNGYFVASLDEACSWNLV